MSTDKATPKKDAVATVDPRPLNAMITTMDDVYSLASAIFKSGAFQGIKNPETAIVRILLGRELGLQPMMSINKIHITEAKDVIIETMAMASSAMAQGVRWEVLKKDPTGCKLRIYKTGGDIPDHSESFTIEDATRADLAWKDNWKKYPEEMCYNRCLSKGLRVFDPRIGAGYYTKEEMEGVDKFGVPPQRQPETQDHAAPNKNEVIEGEIVEEEDYQEEMKKAMDRDPDPPAPKTNLQEEAAEELNESPEVVAQKKEEIEQIRKALTILEIDKKHDEKQTFKEWLVTKQKNKIFLRVNKFGHQSFHLGDAEAVHELNKNSQAIIRKYVDAQFLLLQPGQRVGCFVKPYPEQADA